MHILLFGATGGVGRAFLEQALERGDRVTAAVRSPDKLADIQHVALTVHRCDAFSAADLNALFDDGAHYDACVSCLNTNHGINPSDDLQRMLGNIVPALQKHGIKRVVYCASAGIDGELTGERGAAAMQFLRHPLSDHHAAVALIRAADLDFTVARPLGLTHDAPSFDYAEAVGGVPLGSGRIARADVAHFMLKALHDDAYIGTSVGLSGKA